MKTVATILEIVVVWFQLYSLAITIKGRADCAMCVTDPLLIARMNNAQAIAASEHRRLQYRMNELQARLQRQWSVLA